MAVSKLDIYNTKRDFNATPEPRGKVARSRKSRLRFLVQKHAARRLHYDLRLEWGGVLLSWAVTKGPSVNPGDKRLAVRTEDHPLAYGDFEGVIPSGYGAGTVMLWDTGTWQPLTDPDEGLANGKLEFRILGKRMQGDWVLVRMRSKKPETRENWLLIKESDSFSETEASPLIEAHVNSVTTGRTMSEIAGGRTAAKSGKAKSRASKKRLANPPFQPPQLATLVENAPDGDAWLNEAKYDGYRALVSLGASGCRIFTRSGLDWTEQFAALRTGLDEIDCRNALIDGEIVAANTSGHISFSALQDALKSRGELAYFAFDLLVLDGKKLATLPLIERKQLLQTLLEPLPKRSSIHFSPHIVGNGPRVLEQMCASGQEGVVSKRTDAPYRGKRTRTWLKAKCTRRQEFVVGGYSRSNTAGREFASLLLGSYESGEKHGKLRYRGRVGTGFSDADLASIAAQLKPLVRSGSPFHSVPSPIARSAAWCEPRLVAEVDFTELTDDGYVRHGVFLGLRKDKEARGIHLELPEHTPGGIAPRGNAPTRKTSTKQAANENIKRIAGIVITHPERQVFPDARLSKLQLAGYYAHIAPLLLPLLKDRPVSLLRCPGGQQQKCFFQKHAGSGFPEQVKRIEITESGDNSAQYMYFTNVAGIIAAIQMGTIEFHLWGARNDRLERPDRLVFDLDPGAGIGFARVKQAAVFVRQQLHRLGLESTAMLTGGKGIHVIVALKRTASWETVGAFSKTFATILATRQPDRFVASMSKSKRAGRIFIDWLRNERGATAVAPYSVRARAGAPVAVPVAWDELSNIRAANRLTVMDEKRLLKHKCPLLAARANPQTLSAGVIEKLAAL